MPEERDPDQPEPVDGSTRPSDPGDVWTGRAGVRPHGAVPRDPFDDGSDWADPDAVEPSGRWWAPIAVGTVALALVGLLVFGITVILRNTGDDAEPSATTFPAVRETTGTPDVGVTTPPATIGTATAAPTTDPVDAEVNVPALRGMPLEDAQAALSRSGLAWRVIRRENDAEPGTVINCDPAEGQQVPSDTRVTLVVSAARAGDPSPSATAPSAGTQPTG